MFYVPISICMITKSEINYYYYIIILLDTPVVLSPAHGIIYSNLLFTVTGLIKALSLFVERLYTYVRNKLAGLYCATRALSDPKNTLMTFFGGSISVYFGFLYFVSSY